MEDRAQVTRSGSVRLEAGVRRLRFGPVTALAVDRSLSVEAVPGAGGEVTVVDARIVREYTPEHPGGPDAGTSPLRRLVHDLDARQAALASRIARVRTRLALAAAAREEVLRDIAECTGAGEAHPERWGAALDRVTAEEERLHDESHALACESRALAERLTAARDAAAEAERRPAELTAVIEVVVDAAAAGTAELRLTHVVPCALWRPAYRAVLAADRASVRVECDAVVWQDTGEDWTGVALSLSTARSALAGTPPVLTEDRLTLRDRDAAERERIDVRMREEHVSTVGAAATEVPGVDDGGEVRVLVVPTPVDVPSDGRPHRIPLDAFTAPCETTAECAPELSPLVDQVARFPNRSGRALLAGPVELIRDSGFIGRGRLAFTAPGERVRLPFGAEDDFRVFRDTAETRTRSTFGGRTVVRRTVTLSVSRTAAPGETAPVPVVLRERIGISEVSAVTIELVRNACEPAPDDVDDDGIVRYDLRLAPGERRRLVLVHEVTAAPDVTGL